MEVRGEEEDKDNLLPLNYKYIYIYIYQKWSNVMSAAKPWAAHPCCYLPDSMLSIIYSQIDLIYLHFKGIQREEFVLQPICDPSMLNSRPKDQLKIFPAVRDA